MTQLIIKNLLWLTALTAILTCLAWYYPPVTQPPIDDLMVAWAACVGIAAITIQHYAKMP